MAKRISKAMLDKKVGLFQKPIGDYTAVEIRMNVEFAERLSALYSNDDQTLEEVPDGRKKFEKIIREIFAKYDYDIVTRKPRVTR